MIIVLTIYNIDPTKKANASITNISITFLLIFLFLILNQSETHRISEYSDFTDIFHSYQRNLLHQSQSAVQTKTPAFNQENQDNHANQSSEKETSKKRQMQKKSRSKTIELFSFATLCALPQSAACSIQIIRFAHKLN